MSSPTVKPRPIRAKRREAMFNTLAKLVGCVTVVISVAFVFYVACRQIWRGPAIDPIYEQMAHSSEEVPWVPLEREPPPPQSAAQLPHTAVPAAQPAAEKPVIAAVPISQAVRATPLPVAAVPVSYEARRQDIQATTQRFFSARTIAEKAPVCRDAARVRPLMEAYYQKHPLTASALQKLGWLLPVKEPGYRLVFIQALFQDRAPLSLIAEESADGSFLIDWESSVRYSEIEWKDFLTSRPGEPKLFRVIASRSPRSANGTDENQETLEIKHPAENGTVTAHFDRNDPQLTSLVEQLQLRNWKDVPLTLRLCYPDTKSDGAAVKIAGIEGQGWLILQNTRS